MTLDYNLILAVVGGIAILLTLILVFRIQAFISLLIASIAVGLFAGMNPTEVIKTMQEGMGNTLGFVAMVVGLGAMFGAILEHSGGAKALANFLLQKFGESKASWALMLTGFFVAIPIFFDVAFIILIPLVYALQRRTGKSLLLYAIPLLAGLACTHAFIPPTPGPVAVADILGADLGWVIFFGAIAGLPAAIVSGPIFAKYISGKINVVAPEILEHEHKEEADVSVVLIIVIVTIPIVLILANTLLNSALVPANLFTDVQRDWLKMIGHPFTALIIANLVAWYMLGLKRGFTKDKLLEITTKSMGPAGIIILLTGAGGVFKQMLVNTGTGEMLARYFAEAGVSLIVFSFIAAGLIRVLQGSATVAMITAAGITAPLITEAVDDMHKAMIVVVIAAGASMMSHVNDSGFWLVSKYLGITEKQTFQSWTVMTTLLAFTGFVVIWIMSVIL